MISYRRVALLKARSLEAEGKDGVAAAWRGRQLAAAGTPLPAYVPHREALAEAGYSTVEDLPPSSKEEGPLEGELRSYGLSPEQATEVGAALRRGGPAPVEPAPASKVQRRPKGRPS